MTQREVIFQALKEYALRRLDEIDLKLREIEAIAERRRKQWDLPRPDSQTKDVVN